MSQIRGTVQVGSGGGGGDMRLDVYVTNPQGVVAFHRADVNAVKFSFQTAAYERHTTQAHRVCILHQADHRGAPAHGAFRRITINVEVAKVAKDTGKSGSLASREHADRLQQIFRDVSADVDRLIETMDTLRVGEQQLTDINQSTSSLILRISVVACLLTVLTGVLNVMSLKSFFKQKKLA